LFRQQAQETRRNVTVGSHPQWVLLIVFSWRLAPIASDRLPARSISRRVLWPDQAAICFSVAPASAKRRSMAFLNP
jgi:hypothetical protein